MNTPWLIYSRNKLWNGRGHVATNLLKKQMSWSPVMHKAVETSLGQGSIGLILAPMQVPSTSLCEALTWRVLLPLRGSGQRAKIGGWPGASSLCLCFMQVLQEPGCLIQVQVTIIMIQLLLHLPYVTKRMLVNVVSTWTRHTVQLFCKITAD